MVRMYAPVRVCAPFLFRVVFLFVVTAVRFAERPRAFSLGGSRSGPGS